MRKEIDISQWDRKEHFNFTLRLPRPIIALHLTLM